MRRLVPIALTALVLAGCGDAPPAQDPHAAEIARLTRAVDDLAASNQTLDAEVRRQARQLAGITRERAVREMAAAGAENALASDAADADASGTPSGAPPDALTATDVLSTETVDAILDTAAGQKAIADATAREIERREAQDRRLFVSYRIGMFARTANLDERQTEALQRIWKESMDDGVKLREQFAAIGKLPETERESAREAAMQSMRSLGSQRRSAVAELLSGTQLEEYQAVDEEIVGGLHGAPRR